MSSSSSKVSDSKTDTKEQGQMVTIRRIMDPVSTEPTVTISLKGEQDEKLLYKLVNGRQSELYLELYYL